MSFQDEYSVFEQVYRTRVCMKMIDDLFELRLHCGKIAAAHVKSQIYYTYNYSV